MFVKMIAGLMIVAGLVGVTWGGASYFAKSDCCQPAQACCSSDCCDTGGDCCYPPQECCFSGSCCASAKAADCCAAGDSCCTPASECCFASKAVQTHENCCTEAGK